MNYNRLMMCGRVSRNEAIYYSGAGNAVFKFTMATSRKRGEEEKVTFIDCVAFAKLAEMGAKYLSVGRECIIDGRLELESWVDKGSGQKRSKHVCIVSDVQLGAIPKAQQGAGSQGVRQGGGYQQRNSNSGGYNQGAAYNDNNSQTSEPLADEDIPF